MLEQLELLIKEAKKASEVIKNAAGPIRILSHYDCDGITSAAILIKALCREGKSFHLSLIKQLRPVDIEGLKAAKEKTVVFLDFGSGQLDLINPLLDKSIVILDHHEKQGELKSAGPDHARVHVNPNEFGIDENMSGSGVAYILARALNPENRDLAELAIIGAIGDSQTGSIGPEWGLMGLNKEMLKDAMTAGKIKMYRGLRIWGRSTRPIHKALEYSVDPYIPGVSGSESGAVQFLQDMGITLKRPDGDWRTLSDLSEEEQKKLASGIIIERMNGKHDNPEWIFGDVYELMDKEGEFKNANEFATMLNSCGKSGKGYVGVGLCLNEQKAYESIKKILEEYRRSVGSSLKFVYENKDKIKDTEKARYIFAGDRISEHIISNVVSILNRSWNLGRPVFGFVDAEEGVKISARLSPGLEKTELNLKEIVSQVSAEVGGLGGGHKAAAGATIPAGSEEMFIKKVEEVLSSKDYKPKEAVKAEEKDEKRESEETGPEGREENGEERGEEKREVPKAPGEEAGKKVEGKGLVRYFGS